MSKEKKETPWYAEGLQFQCSQCGDCCTGAPGYVWVNKAEIAAMAKLKGDMAIEVFEKKYVRLYGIRKSLTERKNGDCVFFDTESRHCQVYEARPRQCKTWPFWDSNLKSIDDWKETCEVCPGSGRGKLYSLEAIEKQRSVTHI